MSFSLGNSNIGDIYYGSTKIAEAYLGSELVYTNSMPAYQRYMFRWNFTTDSYFQLSEINLNQNKDTTLSSYTYVASNPSTGNNNEGPAKMLDNSLSTKWCCSASKTTTASLIFDAPSAIRVSSYNLFAGADTKSNPGRRPNEVYLFGTNDTSVTADDDTNWHLLGYSAVANLTTANKGKDTLELQRVDKKKKYQYFQWSFVPAYSQVQMSQIALIDKTSGTISGSSYLKLIGQKNGSNFNASQGPSALFDGKATTWGIYTTAGLTGGITFSSTVPLDVSGIGLREGGDTSTNKKRIPACWALWGSDVPNTNWALNSGWDLLYLGNSNLPAVNYQWNFFETYNVRG